LKITATMFAETLVNHHHSTRRIPESRSFSHLKERNRIRSDCRTNWSKPDALTSANYKCSGSVCSIACLFHSFRFGAYLLWAASNRWPSADIIRSSLFPSCFSWAKTSFSCYRNMTADNFQYWRCSSCFG
jgi:hypothetical protein